MNASVKLISPQAEYSDLPEWSSVLTQLGAEFELPEEQQKSLAALEVAAAGANKAAYIVHAPHQRTSVELHTLRSKLKKAGYEVEQAPIEVSTAVLHGLYEAEADNTDAENRFDSIIRRALNKGASDIHLLVGKDATKVRMRIDGGGQRVDTIKSVDARAMVRVAYENHADFKQPSSYIPSQDMEAQITRIIDGQEINLRFQLKPTVIKDEAYVVYLRLASAKALKPIDSFTDAGYTERTAKDLIWLSRVARGLVLFVGETGSGKTTSVLQLLGYKYRSALPTELNIVTIEDPPEYELDQIVQTPVCYGASNADAFANAVKRSVRCDPDALMVGEIRDEETAKTVMRVAQTDHPVYATVHAGSPIEAILRLRELDMKMDVVGSPSFLAGLVYQRLVPKLCSHCSVPLIEAEGQDEEMTQRLEAVLSHDDMQSVRVSGPHLADCQVCDGTGRVGRSLVAEVVLPDARFKSLVAAGDVQGATNHHYADMGLPEGIEVDVVQTHKHTTQNVIGHGLTLVAEGALSPYELEARIGKVDASQLFWEPR